MGVSPRGATLLEAAPGIFSVSVELAFIQCCATLSFPKALALGYELCGTFSMCEGIWDGWDCDEGSTDPSGYLETEPATTVAALARVVARMPHVRGVKMARSVIANLLDGARSPMEAIVAGVFHMPISLEASGSRRCSSTAGSISTDSPQTLQECPIPSATRSSRAHG